MEALAGAVFEPHVRAVDCSDFGGSIGRGEVDEA
jgi:hypothetical protein